MLTELILRPGDTGLPAVTARLHITAPLPSLAGRSVRPGAVNGQPITAGHVRDLVDRLGFLAPPDPAVGAVTVSITDTDGRLIATVTPSTLDRLARQGCPAHPAGSDCGCPVLGPPPATTAYTPTAAQDEFIRTRDRACRFINCGQRTGWADLDHVIPHACGGATDCANLCCLCRSHRVSWNVNRGMRCRS